MKKLKVLLQNKKAYKFVYGVVCAFILFLTLNAMTLIEHENDDELEKTVFEYKPVIMAWLFAGIFFLMLLTRIIYLVFEEREDEKGKTRIVKNKCYAILYFIAILSLVIIPDKELALRTSFICYFVSLAAGRATPPVLKLLNKNYKKRKRKIIPILFWLYMACLLIEANLEIEHGMFPLMIYLCAGIIMLHYLIKVIVVTFSSIKLDVLKKIIKRSYAVEILSGFAVLILSVAIVLKSCEPSMNSLGDALWYCFALVTTIGFGDYTATTELGRGLSVILGLYGILVVSMITSIFVNFYSETKDSEYDDDDDEEYEKPKKKKRATRVGGMTIMTEVEEKEPEEDEEEDITGQ